MCKETIEYFAEYVRYCYAEYGDKVKYWITLNEPAVFSDEGYDYCEMAPGVCGGKEASRKARHNTILAHAKAYDIYNKEFRQNQNGLVGITLNSDWAHPENPEDPNDILASEIAMSMYLGWWAYPIYGDDGDYSELMKNTLINADEWSEYYEFSDQEKELNKKSSGKIFLNI